MIDIIIEYTVVTSLYYIVHLFLYMVKCFHIVKIQLKYTNHLINVNKSVCNWIELI